MTYLAEGTPDAQALEELVDKVGIRNVIFALARICYEKQEHIQVNWQDAGLSRKWSTNGQYLDKVAVKLHGA